MEKKSVIVRRKPIGMAGTQDSGAVPFRNITIGEIVIRENVRKEYSGIDDLAASIKQRGLLQPITVYRDGEVFVVKTGHRRFKAFQSLYQQDKDRFHSIPCIISTPDNLAIVQLVENVQREDLNPIDLYNGLNALRAEGMSNSEIAQAIGKSHGYVDNLFSGVKEANANPEIAELVQAGVSLTDILETKGVPDEKARLELLDQRKNGKITRSEFRKKAKELKSSTVADKVSSPTIQGEEHTAKISISDGGLSVSVTLDCKDAVLLIQKELVKVCKKNEIKVIESTTSP
ncbi:MAG: ParB/RepB/Spo0J family partition protein [Prevotellaceae bacterium]|jgi:ParB family chromosome partitioning protein|nr:ParB/RepB/Spo0J family partition protein [Prevotellaceae bacterium]